LRLLSDGGHELRVQRVHGLGAAYAARVLAVGIEVGNPSHIIWADLPVRLTRIEGRVHGRVTVAIQCAVVHDIVVEAEGMAQLVREYRLIVELAGANTRGVGTGVPSSPWTSTLPLLPA
jgi:hypothetical protein